MVEDEARTKADAARVTREALLKVAVELEVAGDRGWLAHSVSLRGVARAPDEVMLRIRGLIR